MPTYHIYSRCCFTKTDKPYIYSVDMMLAYVNLFKHPVVKLDIQKVLPQLKEKLWDDFSPMDVLENPTKKAHVPHMTRIENADLSYPIFVTSEHNIIDGAHRITKAFMQDKQVIHAYVFNKALMKKFVIYKEPNEKGGVDEAGADRVKLNEVLALFYKRFT
jgi:hypothetical protein